ncbi:guanine nucleotide binding protein, alpha subunit, partial [Obelidium mucronatum]
IGPSESGKSTVLKQITLIYGTGFTPEQAATYREAMHTNLLVAISTLIKAMDSLEIPYSFKKPESVEERTQRYSDLPKVPETTISAIKQLWADSGVQYCFSRANEFQLVDSCAYIMENIDRVSDLNFVPTDDDILNARIMTHGIHESKFKAGKMSLVIYDVGGHRSERKKWAQFFEDAQAIIFIVAVSAYDQVCMEDEETSRMVEGFKLFDSICNHPLFTKTDMVLFLNKIDLFEEKIKVRPISLFFLDYRGPNEYKDSAKYFVKRFQNINKFPEDKKIYPHLTHATDTRQTKKILKSVLDSIQQYDMIFFPLSTHLTKSTDRH